MTDSEDNSTPETYNGIDYLAHDPDVYTWPSDELELFRLEKAKKAADQLVGLIQPGMGVEETKRVVSHIRIQCQD